MIVMQLSNLRKSFVTDLVFDKVTLEVKSGENIGIVGKNGAGKTTLMKIMAGEMSYDGGSISMPKGTSIGYLTQQMTLESKLTVREEMMRPFEDLLALQEEMDTVTRWLEDNEYSHPRYEEYVDKLARLQNAFENADGYNIDSSIKMVLTGLNFDIADLDRPVDEFSGGQKTRLSLAQMLLRKPDVLLLDEPTNHLDVETVEWLEHYLKNFQGAVVIISHDRYFLDKTVDKIFEVELGKGTLYHSNYSKYVIEKEKRHRLEMKQYERQQKEISKLETFVEKNIARASTSGMAKDRRKKLEMMERVNAPRQDHKNADFSFSIRRESGNDVFRVKDLAIGYDEVLNSGISFSVEKGDRLAILGPNGIGKSTLVKTIAKKISKISGEIVYGTNVSIGYYDQKQAEFTSDKNVLEELWSEYPEMKESDIRKILGRFLFTQDEVLKSVNDLSGGEKARIQLAKLMLEKNNVLILDEPTNHLDIDSKEVLEDALDDFEGTIIFVSHDRYFINRIADRILEIQKEDVFLVNGDYDYFLHKKEEKRQTEVAPAPSKEKDAPKENLDYEAQKKLRNEISRLKKQVKQYEEEIAMLETEIEDLEAQLLDPEIYNDYTKSAELNTQLIEKNERLEQVMNEWAESEELLTES
ncbi:ABC-F family ATP-binding cassette domain-containing protein [Salinicoccus halitifaciens]|uniref:ATP-binding cassette subfamily F protein 3 n=1 Tax=Salinicoccus halitifaciens TaxID=1073415 RepID=A0ABV2ED94_9STAP|nr:ABC-F family ATP-binding cassette domain-containing protein [Salinicoccus halitifaciens]MCD2137323.1 ABC-F family ATP-binding cassette domain-containing protein [Salinicoccus halitifaciens]